MSFDYAPLAKTATNLLARYGQGLTFTRTSKGAYDPAAGKTSDTTSTFTKNCVLFDYRDADINGQTVLAGDRRAVAEAHAYQVGDTVAVGSDVFRVISVSANQPGDTAMISELQIRK
tara:strand:+ start:1405 stop:1755 length:351 start_codon:yes stop_codon:yes gene_type:complete